MNRLLHVSWVLLALMAAGCASVPPERGTAAGAPGGAAAAESGPELPAERNPGADPTPGSTAGTDPGANPGRAPDTAPPAVIALLGQADAASQSGAHGRAAALLERALRIDPNNPGLWHNLAVVRYREGDYAQAESMAMRSNRYADGRRALMARNWELIAVSRELSGNSKGAGEARARARALSEGVRT